MVPSTIISTATIDLMSLLGAYEASFDATNLSHLSVDKHKRHPFFGPCLRVLVYLGESIEMSLCSVIVGQKKM